MKSLLLFVALLNSMLWLGDVSTPGALTTDISKACAGILIGEPRRGCCSWHGGVCGCGGARLLCCDGTLSPTCPCHQWEIATLHLEAEQGVF